MGTMESLKFLASPKYIRNLATLVVAYGININLVEVTWKSKHKVQFPSPNEYSSFMSDFSTATGQRGGSTAAVLLQRPRTMPDLLVGRRSSSAGTSPPPPALQFPLKLTKLLLNVTRQRSTGALQVLVPPDSTVDDLIAVALHQYVNEERRPVLLSTNAADYGLYYSQFSL